MASEQEMISKAVATHKDCATCWPNGTRTYRGPKWTPIQGPHKGHTVRATGRDGLFPDDPLRGFARCSCGSVWGFRIGVPSSEEGDFR